MEKTKPGEEHEEPSRQAPPGAWTPDALRKAVSDGTTEEKIKLLTELGILQDGELAPRYKNWGRDVSRTEDEEAADEP